MKNLNEKLVYTCVYFNSFDDCQKAVDILKRENFHIELKNSCRDDCERERTTETIKLFHI